MKFFILNEEYRRLNVYLYVECIKKSKVIRFLVKFWNIIIRVFVIFFVCVVSDFYMVSFGNKYECFND